MSNCADCDCDFSEEKELTEEERASLRAFYTTEDGQRWLNIERLMFGPGGDDE